VRLRANKKIAPWRRRPKNSRSFRRRPKPPPSAAVPALDASVPGGRKRSSAKAAAKTHPEPSAATEASPSAAAPAEDVPEPVGKKRRGKAAATNPPAAALPAASAVAPQAPAPQIPAVEDPQMEAATQMEEATQTTQAEATQATLVDADVQICLDSPPPPSLATLKVAATEGSPIIPTP
jgi:hypothetical protein